MDLAYQGPERRRRRAFVTRNTEYHFLDAVCVAVRDLRTGRWLPSHLAINRQLTGGVEVRANGAAIPMDSPPAVGQALYFGEGERDLVTSTLCAIERPPIDVVRSYPS